jgi:hypothetical protein
LLWSDRGPCGDSYQKERVPSGQWYSYNTIIMSGWDTRRGRKEWKGGTVSHIEVIFSRKQARQLDKQE